MSFVGLPTDWRPRSISFPFCCGLTFCDLYLCGWLSMIARVHSSLLQGSDAIACEVEADVAIGSTGEITLVGLAEASVKEADGGLPE